MKTLGKQGGLVSVQLALEHALFSSCTVMNKGVCAGGVQNARDYKASRASVEGRSEVDCVLLCDRKPPHDKDCA